MGVVTRLFPQPHYLTNPRSAPAAQTCSILNIVSIVCSFPQRAVSSGTYADQGFGGIQFVRVMQPSSVPPAPSSPASTPTLPPSDGGLAPGQLSGIIVGSVVGGILLIVLLFLLIRCW